MQFYIIHPDPETNWKMLPEYAKQKVNAWEGYTILSDIGTIHDIEWDERCKEYSLSHVLTRTICQNRENFLFFISHYDYCVRQYGKSFLRKYEIYREQAHDRLVQAIPVHRNKYQFNIDYLLNQKRDKLTEKEIEYLTEVRQH
jgi:hypothetical protein